MTVFCVDDGVEAGKSFVETDDIMQDFLVDLMSIFELTQVDALGSADNLDFGGMGKVVVEGNDHTTRDIEKLAVNLENLCCHGKIFLEAMSRCAKKHESTTHANNVLLSLEDVGHMNLDLGVLVFFGLPDFCNNATTGRPLVHAWSQSRVFLFIFRVGQLGRSTNQSSQCVG